MSLLLGARGKAHVVVMTDGISILQDGQKTRIERLDLQKLFPSKTKSYVLAHHGQNKIGPFGCDTLLPNLINDELDRVWNKGLNVTIAKAIETLDNAVCQHIKTLNVETVFGLWLAGLWPCTDIPEIVELLWSRPGPRRVRIEVKTHGDLVWGGSGSKFVADLVKMKLLDKYSVDGIYGAPPEYSMEYLKLLYAKAVELQKASEDTIFGGQARMALITEHGVDLGIVGEA